MSQLQRLAAAVRPLPIALAHYCATARPGSPRAEIASRLYHGNMGIGQRLQFLGELHECRAARREQREARIA